MSRVVVPVFAAMLAVFTLGGCGGSQTGQPLLQDKQLSPSMKQASSPYATAVQELYVAYFGRPADPSGLANFENALASAGAPTDISGLTSAYSDNQAVRSLIDSFGTSNESQTLYGSGSTQDFVAAIFNNVLDRAPQAAGLAYWSGAIDGGSLSKGDAALAIMDGALTNTSVQGLIDAQLVNNRLAVAAAFTTQVSSEGATSAYSGAAAAASARAMLAKVDSNTNTSGFATTITSTVATLLQSKPGISLVAGNTTAGIPLNNPTGMVRDSLGNLYVLDQTANSLDKIAPDGTFSVLAGNQGASGSADGVGAAASFYFPNGLAIDGQGNLYVSDTQNVTIRKVTSDGVVTTVAGQVGAVGSVDGPARSAKFSSPQGVAVDTKGNLYVADARNNTIRKITPGGIVSTMAGQTGKCGYADGVGSAAQFCNPGPLIVDGTGNLYVVDSYFHTIRKVTPDSAVSTLAGSPGYKGAEDGAGSAAHFCSPAGLAFDNTGNLLVSDQGCYGSTNVVIRKVTPTGVVTTIAGNNGAAFVGQTAATAAFVGPEGLAMDASGNIFVADYSIGTIWEVSASGSVTIFAGLNGVTGSADGSGAFAGFSRPQGIVADGAGNLYVADWHNDTIRKISPSGQVTTFAGTAGTAAERDGVGPAASLDMPVGLTTDTAGNLYVMDYGGHIRIISPAGAVTTLPLPNSMPNISNGTEIVRDKAGNIYVSESYFNVILKITPDGSLSTLAGMIGQSGSADGTGAAARFNNPSGMAVDGAGNLYVADTSNETIRKIDSSGNVTTVAGSAGATGFVDGVGAAARLHYPGGLAFDAAGNLYIADNWNNAIRKLTPAGNVSTVSGSASGSITVFGTLPGAVNRPESLTVVGLNTLYVTSDNAVLRIQIP